MSTKVCKLFPRFGNLAADREYANFVEVVDHFRKLFAAARVEADRISDL
jgi:hypothetical protein